MDGEILLDLCYEEDSRADVDMNFVMTAGKKLVEVQATAEHQVFDEEQLGKMIGLAESGSAGADRETAGGAGDADVAAVNCAHCSAAPDALGYGLLGCRR